MELYVPSIFQPFPNLVACESTRLGGFSRTPYASLNLSLHTDDDPNAVEQNRKTFFESLGFSTDEVACAFQVHGTEVLLATQAGETKGYDALITNQKGLLLTVTVADCTPILIYDAGQLAIAAIHAGWRGTVGEIVIKTLEKMQNQFGTQPKDCHAYVGTCISERNFEVDADVAQHFDPAFKTWDRDRGKYLIDLKMANQRQLEECGIPARQIERSPFCTVRDNEQYFSHRKEKGTTGRMLGVIGMR